MEIRIAFAGKMCSGKSTAAEHLVTVRGFEEISLVEPLRRLVREICPFDRELRRQMMQVLGHAARQVYPNVWIDTVVRRLVDNPEGRYVIADVRFPNEVTMLREWGFEVYRIVASEETRIKRHEHREGFTPPRLILEDETETALDGVDLLEIDGELPIGEFCNAIDKVVFGFC